MFSKTIIFGIVTFLHDLFTAIWIGGLFTLALSVFPAVRNNFGKSPQTQQLSESIQKRHSVWVYISLVGLIITGLLLSKQSPDFLGLFQFGDTYSMLLSSKHILVIFMIAASLYRSLAIGKKEQLTPRQQKTSFLLLISNLTAGLLVLLMSGFLTAIS